jgi:hypothetical protein
MYIYTYIYINRKKHASLSLRNSSPERGVNFTNYDQSARGTKGWDQTAEGTKRATVQSAGGQSRPGTGATGKMDETNPPSPTAITAGGPRGSARATTPSFKKAVKRYTFVFKYIHLYLCTYTDLLFKIWLPYINTHKFISIHIDIHVFISLYIYIYEYADTYIHLSIYIHVQTGYS